MSKNDEFGLKKWWNENGIWIIIFGSIILIVILWIIKYFFKDSFDEDVPALDYLFYKDSSQYRSYLLNDKKKVSKGEQICKDTATHIFRKPFVKVRPKFLINPKTGKPLELDVYNDELKLAIEYNGKQHYEYIPKYFHRSYEDFLEQKYRDELKREKCRENGIKLIEVPYTVKFADIPQFIRTRASQHKII